jgi:energy-coupling factor transporter ATP-binding protein EcfA2
MDLRIYSSNVLKDVVKRLHKQNNMQGWDYGRDVRTKKIDDCINYINTNFNATQITKAIEEMNVINHGSSTNETTSTENQTAGDGNQSGNGGGEGANNSENATGVEAGSGELDEDGSIVEGGFESDETNQQPISTDVDMNSDESLAKQIQKKIDEAGKRAKAKAEKEAGKEKEKAVKEALQDQPPQQIEVVYPDSENIMLDEIQHHILPDLINLVNWRSNILLVGPAGCGKTTICKTLAKACKLDYGFISLSGGVSENNLTGCLLPVEENGSFRYIATRFIDLFLNGGLFLLDDLAGASADCMLVLNSAIANAEMYVSQRYQDQHLKRHKDFVIIGATNTTHGSAMYSGQEAIDGSTLDRFQGATRNMDYSKTLEKKIIHPDVLKWGWALRKQIKDKKIINRIVSTRVLEEFSKQKRLGNWGSDKWEMSMFATWRVDELNKIGKQRLDDGAIVAR